VKKHERAGSELDEIAMSVVSRTERRTLRGCFTIASAKVSVGAGTAAGCARKQDSEATTSREDALLNQKQRQALVHTAGAGLVACRPLRLPKQTATTKGDHNDA